MPRMTNRLLTTVVMGMAIGCVFPTFMDARPASGRTNGNDCPNCVADFALYDPSYEDDGVWEEEVTALKAMFSAYGFTYKIISAKEINAGSLGSGSSRKYRALIEPGGWAYYRNVLVKSAGENYIRSFINSGGNYIGFCAGAWNACQILSWDQNGTGNYQDYYYDLKLFTGTGKGPLGWLPWENGTNPDLDEVKINTSNGTMKKIGIPAKTRFFYAGGPWFIPSGTPSKYEVWARASKPAGASNTDGDGQPTIVKYAYGSGTVILFAYHPEILIDSMVDNVKLSQYYKEDQIDWSTGTQTMDQINLQSWNIVHAALQIAAKKTVTKITKLPGE